MKKRILAVILVITVAFGLLPLSAYGAGGVKFIENDHWKEVSPEVVTPKYNKKESFVAMFFRYTCFNSNLRKTMVEEWMDSYNMDVTEIVSQRLIKSKNT